MNPEIKKLLSYPYWRQCIELDANYKTPGRVDKEFWNMLHFPDDLTERSFLDVGANDGLFSFIAEKKGAKRIISSDLYKEDVGSMEIGWFHKDEVQVYYHQPSLYFKLLRSVKMESIYYAIKCIINKRK